MVQHAALDHTGITGPASPQLTTIELGHASDTTLARVSAGVVSIEGTNIVKAGAATASGLTQATARMLGRTTAATGAIEEITVGTGLSLAAGSLTATGAAGISAGTSFPGGPSTSDLFHRTDLACALWRYDGTRWRCTPAHTITMPMWNQTNVGSSGTQAGSLRCAIPDLLGGSDLWLLTTTLKHYVNGGTALDGSHNWVGTLAKVDSAAADTTIATWTINSGVSSTWRVDTQTINALLGSGFFIFQTSWTKTGTPGNLLHHVDISYQHVAT